MPAHACAWHAHVHVHGGPPRGSRWVTAHVHAPRMCISHVHALVCMARAWPGRAADREHVPHACIPMCISHMHGTRVAGRAADRGAPRDVLAAVAHPHVARAPHAMLETQAVHPAHSARTTRIAASCVRASHMRPRILPAVVCACGRHVRGARGAAPAEGPRAARTAARAAPAAPAPPPRRAAAGRRADERQRLAADAAHARAPLGASRRAAPAAPPAPPTAPAPTAPASRPPAGASGGGGGWAAAAAGEARESARE